MRRSFRIALWIAGVAGAVLLVVGAMAGVIVLRRTTITETTDERAAAEFSAIVARFPPRPALIEIGHPTPGEFRVNRPAESAPRHPVETFHVLAWTGREATLVRTSAPVWLMRLSLPNLVGELGIPLGPLHLTVDDVRRYGPGIALDFTPPGGGRVLVWLQ